MQNISSIWYGKKDMIVFYKSHMSAQAIAIAAKLIVVAYRNDIQILLVT